jgi:drug/metabolite transporter (DMT)-like permease
MMLNLRFLPYLLIILTGVIWGGTFSLTLIATSGGAHPLGITIWQIAVTVLFFMLLCLFGKVPLFQFKHIRHYLFIAVIGVTLPNLAYYYAAPFLSAGILSITVSTIPVLTYGLMVLLRFESVVIKRVMGIALGMIAILLLVIPDQGLESDDANLWILLAILSSAFYSIENVYVDRGIAITMDVRELLFGANLIGVMIQFPLVMWLGVGEPVSWLMTKPGLATALTAIVSGLAYALFMYIIRTSGSVFASQTAYIITISGVAWGMILFGEEHSIWAWLSIAVMMLGMFLVTPRNQNKVQED